MSSTAATVLLALAQIVAGSQLRGNDLVPSLRTEVQTEVSQASHVSSSSSSDTDLDLESDLELTNRLFQGLYSSTASSMGGSTVLRAAGRVASVSSGLRLESATLPDGSMLSCLECDEGIFTQWLLSRMASKEIPQQGPGCPPLVATSQLPAAGDAHINKHPNAPLYDAWAKSRNVSLLQVGEGLGNSGCTQLDLSMIHTKEAWDQLRPALKASWEDRRLIRGPGAPGFGEKRQTLVETLTTLAEDSPWFVAADCTVPGGNKTVMNLAYQAGLHVKDYCDALMESGRPVAKRQEIQSSLAQTFGQDFITLHSMNTSWTADEERVHAQAVLTALKSNYTFYHQNCIQPKGQTCDMKSPAESVGQIACAKTDLLQNGSKTDCIYSNILQCTSCSLFGYSSAPFFEYARYHGPLALLDMTETRNRVMGQCEEFSRAAHAMFAALGWEPRYVLDFTDHVWIELKMKQADGTSAWVHADPSEGVLDSPTMYEKGWGKKLTVILALTPFHIDDVTSKYTEDYAAILSRRGISEETLNAGVSKANVVLTSHAFPQDKLLSKMLAMEPE